MQAQMQAQMKQAGVDISALQLPALPGDGAGGAAGAGASVGLGLGLGLGQLADSGPPLPPLPPPGLGPGLGGGRGGKVEAALAAAVRAAVAIIAVTVTDVAIAVTMAMAMAIASIGLRRLLLREAGGGGGGRAYEGPAQLLGVVVQHRRHGGPTRMCGAQTIGGRAGRGKEWMGDGWMWTQHLRGGRGVKLRRRSRSLQRKSRPR